jgi:hypothetical protein
MMRHFNSALWIATSLCSGVAAYYWYLSSRHSAAGAKYPVAAMADNPDEHLLVTQVNSDTLQVAFVESSRLNKVAALWSALAAAFGTIAAIASAI